MGLTDQSRRLEHSQVEELAQFMTDYVGSRPTASLQRLGLSNPRSAFAAEFTRGGWDVVKTYAAMTAPYYCAFSVNSTVRFAVFWP